MDILPAPTNLIAEAAPENMAQDQILLYWDLVPGAASYTIYRNGEEWYPNINGTIVIDGVTYGQYFDYPVEFNTNYIYAITAVNGEGVQSPQSIPVVGIVYGDAASALATVADLSAFWRTVTAAETPRAEQLLLLATNRLRAKATELGINLDERAVPNSVYLSNVKFVILEAVKRAMQTDQSVPPVDTYQKAAGPYSENYKFTNPSGDLWFKDKELAEIGLIQEQSIGMIAPNTRGNIYGLNNTEDVT